MNSWFSKLKQATYNTSLMYNLRMLIAFAGTAFVPYFLDYQLATIPLTLGVVAGLSDIDDRFSVRIMNLVYTYVGFFAAATSVQLLFPHPVAFAGVDCGLYFLDFIGLFRAQIHYYFLWMLGGVGLLDARRTPFPRMVHATCSFSVRCSLVWFDRHD